jgi:DNA-binding MarR family transcriptional regulator
VSARQPGALLLDIWVAGELAGALLDQKLEEEGIDSYAWGTLSVIGAYGPITPSELAERTGRPVTTVSDVVRKLVERGDVERLSNPDDGRSYLLRLTSRGDKRWRKGWPALRSTIRAVSSRLGRPLAEVHDPLWELIGALREAAGEVTPKP